MKDQGGSVDVKKGTLGGSAEVSNYHLGMMQMTLLLEVSVGDGNNAMVCNSSAKSSVFGTRNSGGEQRKKEILNFFVHTLE
jgi:hypothetical protein